MAKAGRKRIQIDEVMLEKLSKLHLSNETIADCVGVSVWTLDRNYAKKMSEWRSKSKSKIADVLFDEGVNKRQPWALKLLAQRHLGYFELDKALNDKKAK
jgi:hypothetical protein